MAEKDAKKENSNLVEELKKMEADYEEMLPIEKKLVGWSIGIGVTALIVLVLVGQLFFEL